jgi:peptide/nickel transport system permease protein
MTSVEAVEFDVAPAGQSTSTQSEKRKPGRQRRRGFERLLGSGILIGCLLAFIIVPYFTLDPNALVAIPQQGPSGAHWFGTDQLGRDIFARVFVAGRLDLLLTVVSTALCVLVGTSIGLLLASTHRYARAVLMRVVDAVLAIPFVLIVVALVNALGTRQPIPFLTPSVGSMLIAIIIVGWTPYTRFTVAQALVLREREHVVAARLLGYSRVRILARHIAPAVLGVNLAYAASQAVATISLIASLAFLGAGVQEPTPDLGAMMSGGVALLSVAWWITIIPGLFVLLLGVGFALVADSSRR